MFRNKAELHDSNAAEEEKAQSHEAVWQGKE